MVSTGKENCTQIPLPKELLGKKSCKAARKKQLESAGKLKEKALCSVALGRATTCIARDREPVWYDGDPLCIAPLFHISF